MAGDALDEETYNCVYIYDINSNHWDSLPNPGQNRGILQIINGKLTIIGGRDHTTRKITNKVTTYINNSWRNYHPNMLKARGLPGVVTHLDYVIVAGGALDNNTNSDDIELLNYKQSSHWVIVKMKLPEAMYGPSLTISNDLLYIVGYTRTRDRINAAYCVLACSIFSASTIQFTSNQTAHWTELPPVPHYSTAIIPNSCPPVIIGGDNIKGFPTVDIRALDETRNSWKRIASLTTAKSATAVVPINNVSILVIGGFTRGRDVEDAMVHCISTVEKGTVRLCHTQ